jgi:cobalt-zinc-cadmium efflux system outer membrane protein
MNCVATTASLATNPCGRTAGVERRCNSAANLGVTATIWLWALASGLSQQPPVGYEMLPPPSASARPWQSPPQRPERILTLADLESLALANNPSFARAAANLEALRGKWLQAGLSPNPIVSLGQQQTGSRGLAEQDGVSVTQEFVRGDKLRLGREVVGQEVVRAEHQLFAQEQRILTDVRIAFYGVAIARRKGEVAEELVRIAQEGVQIAQRVSKGDEIGKNDILEAQIELANAQIGARKSANRFAAAWQTLSAVSGMSHLRATLLESSLEALPRERTWPETVQRLLASSPELAIAAADVERARWTLARAAAEQIPNATLNGLLNWRDNGIGGRSDGALLLSFPVPIWNRNQGGVTQAQGELAVAQRALDQLGLELQQRLTPVFERYVNARQQVDQYRGQILPAAREALELTRRNYQKGLVIYDDLLTSQRTNVQSNRDYLDALQDLRVADAEIEGLLLSGSLK